MARVIIIDPNFENVGGHYLPANQYFASHVKGEVIILASRFLPDLVSVDNATIYRVLPFNVVKARSLSKRFPSTRGIKHFFQSHGLSITPRQGYFSPELKKAFHDLKVGSADKLLVHTGGNSLLRAIVNVLDGLTPDRRPELHYRAVWYEPPRKADQSHHVRLAALCRQGHAYVYYETDDYRNKLIQLGYDGSRIDKLELAQKAENWHPAPEVTNTLKVAILGGARREKGGMRLASIYRHYCQLAAAIDGNVPSLEYIFHTTDHTWSLELSSSITKEFDQRGVAYRFSKASGTSNLYLEKMLESHLVMLPYEVKPYIGRGSGLACDALANGRVVVVSDGSTLTEYIRNGNGLAATTDEDFAKALIEIATGYKRFEKAARAEMKAFISNLHNNAMIKRLNA